MDTNEADYERLVGTLYESSLEASGWAQPMSQLLALIGGTGFHFLGWDAQQGVATFSAMSDSWAHCFEGYHAEFGKIDPHLRAGAQDPEGTWLVAHQRFDERFVSRDRYYQEFLIPGGVRHLMGTSLVRGGGVDVVAAVGRAVGCAPFSDDDVAMVRRITPHMQRAVRLQMETQELRSRAQIGEMALDAMDSGVLAAGRSGRIIFANQFADKLLQDATTLRSHLGRVRAAHGQDDKELQAAIELVLVSHQPRTVRLRGPTGKAGQGCSVTVIPLAKDSRFGAAFNRPDVLLLVNSPQHRDAPGASEFMALFGLTQAEARLAEGLASGLALDDYAALKSVSKETVKKQLNAVFAKTGTRRQQDLVRVLCRVPVPHHSAAGRR